MTYTLQHPPLNLSLEAKAVQELLSYFHQTYQTLKSHLSGTHSELEIETVLPLPATLSLLISDLHLYQCSNCGHLEITTTLLEGSQRLHSCDQDLLEAQGKLSSTTRATETLQSLSYGTLERQVSGSLDELIQQANLLAEKLEQQTNQTLKELSQWAHSQKLGLDNPLKGI